MNLSLTHDRVRRRRLRNIISASSLWHLSLDEDREACHRSSLQELDSDIYTLMISRDEVSERIDLMPKHLLFQSSFKKSKSTKVGHMSSMSLNIYR